MQHYISPNYDYEKLRSPCLKDRIDIFEDRMRGWLFWPVENLIRLEHGQIAAVALLMGYFEGIEIYFSGKDSKRKSKEFFTSGFLRVVQPKIGDDALKLRVVHAIYDQVRCGFVHDGLFRKRVFISCARPEPLLITPSRSSNSKSKDGEDVESIVVNPTTLFDRIKVHFSQDIKSLRRMNDKQLVCNFQAAVDIKWMPYGEFCHVGMTEEEFRRS